MDDSSDISPRKFQPRRAARVFKPEELRLLAHMGVRPGLQRQAAQQQIQPQPVAQQQMPPLPMPPLPNVPMDTRDQRAARNPRPADDPIAAAQRQLVLLTKPYQTALGGRPAIAELLQSHFEAATAAIDNLDEPAANDALGKLMAVLKTPKSGEAALLTQAIPKLQTAGKSGPVLGEALDAKAENILQGVGKTGPVAGQPLGADARLDRTSLINKLKTELEQKLGPMDQSLVPLYQSSIGVDLLTLRSGITSQLATQPLTMAKVIEAESLFKELRIKAEFVAKRDHKIGNRRKKLDEYSDALQFKPGAADALLNDKSLKAGEHFKDFAKALKAYELNAAAKETAALTASIDSYLRHFGKMKESEQAKVENVNKHKAVIEAQRKLAARAIVAESKQMAAKGNWTREDESKATGNYLSMMLLMSETPPRNLKGEHATEKVLAIKNIKGADKLVVKPITGELPVEGFNEGSGASREMLASVMGDKLQEMLGIELNVAATKLASIDGSLIGLEPGKAVTVSAQAFAKQAATLKDTWEARMDQEARRLGINESGEKAWNKLPADVIDKLKAEVVAKIPKEEVHNKAVFDLISLHCDRHLGNFMAGADNKLVPIDHGNILPTKAGILARQAQMGPPHAVLATAPAAKQKLGDEQVERIERLDTAELMATMKAAQAEMRRSTPDADKGDLDEGLDNAKRSIEFLKFACRTLTLEEIYTAYSRSAVDIFFCDDNERAAGFARAVKFAMTYRKATQDLEAKMDREGVSTWGGRRQIDELLPGLQRRGWLRGLSKAEFEAWADSNPHQLVKILDPSYPPPPHDALAASNDAKPDKFLGEDVQDFAWKAYQAEGGDAGWDKSGGKPDVALLERTAQLTYVKAGGDAAWVKAGGKADVPIKERTIELQYQKLGGDAAWTAAGGKPSHSVRNRIEDLEKYERVGGAGAWGATGGKADEPLARRLEVLGNQQYALLGGDVAWLRAGGDDSVKMAGRVKVLQALAEVANIPLD